MVLSIHLIGLDGGDGAPNFGDAAGSFR